MCTRAVSKKVRRTVVEPKNIIMGISIKVLGSMMKEVDLVLSLTPKTMKREVEIGFKIRKKVSQRNRTIAPGKT
jgi:hypothetical protein